MGLLDNKTAMITGAGRGIGRAHALHLAEEGARVLVNDVDAAAAAEVVAEVEAAGGTAIANTDDIATYAGAGSMLDQVLDAWGQADILVNNAGILRDAMSFSIDEDDWNDVIRVHMSGHLAPSHVVGKHWRELSKSGTDSPRRIINTASESGLYGLVGQINYAAAKAGIASMTIVLARELKKYQVTVNAIAPRARTRMTETVLVGLEPQEGQFDEWDPANISPTVAWLASDRAERVNGQVFVVFANRLHLMSGWDLANTIETTGQWTAEGIADRADELFGDRRSGIPAAGFGG